MPAFFTQTHLASSDHGITLVANLRRHRKTSTEFALTSVWELSTLTGRPIAYFTNAELHYSRNVRLGHRTYDRCAVNRSDSLSQFISDARCPRSLEIDCSSLWGDLSDLRQQREL